MAALGPRNGAICAKRASMACSEFCPVIRPTACCRLRDAAGRGGGDPDESAPSQRQIELQAVAAGDDGAMQIGQAGEADHGIDDLLPVRGGMNHLALLNDGVRFVMRRAGAGWREGEFAAHVEFDFARQFDDGFGVMAVLEQRVFDGLGAVDEQAAIEAVLFLGDPLAAAVPADKDDGRWQSCTMEVRRASRWCSF